MCIWDRHYSIRKDWNLIESLIDNKSTILDIGCGEGGLIKQLENNIQSDTRGIELDPELTRKAIADGLNVVQGDAENDLSQYSNQSFDYVILSRTLQATHKPKEVLKEMLRIGKKCIVSIPNFAHWKCRLDLLLKGEMPMTKTLSEPWYQTPNIHLCTIKDLITICNSLNISIDKAFRISQSGSIKSIKTPESFYNNLFSVEGIFVISQKI